MTERKKTKPIPEPETSVNQPSTSNIQISSSSVCQLPLESNKDKKNSSDSPPMKEMDEKEGKEAKEQEICKMRGFKAQR